MPRLNHFNPPRLLWLVVGIILGWFSHEYLSLEKQNIPAYILRDDKPNNRFEKTTNTHKPPQKSDNPGEFSENYFSYLLNEQAYQEAIDFLTHKNTDEANEKNQEDRFRKITLQHLISTLEDTDRNNAELILIFDYYLNRRYDDIKILILLARYHYTQGYINDALQTLQLALTYSHHQQQQQQTSQALDQLVKNTGQKLSDDPLELLYFYERLDSLSLSKPTFYLRQAELYIQLDDFDSARAILNPLLDHKQFEDKARQQLALIRPKNTTPQQVAEPETTALRLTKTGSHYLLDITASDTAELSLMIDTGASMTTLSEDRFEAISHQLNFRNLGQHLFHTAGGVTRGNVYRIDSINIGEHRLENINIAVLNFTQTDGSDGLLGMNILKHFRFEIDQDKNLLNLQRR